jgi:sigma-B regulation protein RsbU (phosphoserine phosphatase)
LLAEARRERSPRQVLASVHRLLLELGDANMFVTVFYAVIDRAARVMTFTRAGHEKPLLLRNGTFQALGDKGTALGLLDAGQVSLPEEQISLLPGDRLVLYTDGLTDAVGSEGQPFGLERLEKTLARHAHLAPTALSADLFSEIAAFQGTTEQYDDMALLVMDVK